MHDDGGAAPRAGEISHGDGRARSLEPLRSSSFFYGWVIVATAVVGTSIGPGVLILGSFGFFLLAFAQEFGWARGEASLSFALFVGATALTLPFVGRLMDRHGVRRILLWSTFVYGLCLLAIPFVVSRPWHLAIIFLVVGTLGAGSNALPYSKLVSVWFDRRRGLALGLTIAGLGLGYIYVPLLTAYMIGHYGWRSAYAALGALVLGVALPLIALLLRETPADLGLQPDGEARAGDPRSRRPQGEATGYSLREAMRTRTFMTLFAIILLMSVVLTGLLAHLVPFLADAGASSAEAAIASSLVGVAVLFGRVIVGYLFDRLFAPHVAIAFFALSAAGIGWLMVAPTGFSLYLACALVGLSVGAEIDFLAYVTGRYFGLRAFGGIYGLLMTASLAGGAIGSATLGFAFEWFGSYNPPLIAGLLLNAVAILLTATLDRYRDDNRRQRAQSMDQAADARS